MLPSCNWFHSVNRRQSDFSEMWIWSSHTPWMKTKSKLHTVAYKDLHGLVPAHLSTLMPSRIPPCSGHTEPFLPWGHAAWLLTVASHVSLLSIFRSLHRCHFLRGGLRGHFLRGVISSEGTPQWWPLGLRCSSCLFYFLHKLPALCNYTLHSCTHIFLPWLPS